MASTFRSTRAASRAGLGAALLLLLLTSCGYTAGLRMPEGSTTLGLEVFGNDGPLPNLERDLHAQLTTSARKLVTGRIVDPGDADLVVRGNITRYRRRGGLRTSGNDLRETGLLIRIEAQLFDDRGRPVGRRVSQSVDVGYLTRTIGAESEAERRAFRNLADGLMLSLFAARKSGSAPQDPGTDPLEDDFEPADDTGR